MSSLLLHASCVALNGQGILLAGAPGSGKSAMALQLIQAGAELVADDQTVLSLHEGLLTAAPPPTTAGLMEVRYVGLLHLPFRPAVPVVLFVDLVAEPSELERLPEPDRLFLLDQPVRRLRLPSYESATPAKIRAALLYTNAEQVSPEGTD